MKGRKRFIAFVILTALAGLLMIGVRWWRWQAPYRTLKIFVRALYDGDINGIYNLIPDHEREQAGVTMELIRRTYNQFLKPLLDQHYPHNRLTNIQRERVVRHPNEVLFYLWFRGEKHPLVIYLYRSPKGWRVPFSYFIWLTAKGLYGDPNPLMRQLGYQRIATTSGDTFRLQ